MSTILDIYKRTSLDLACRLKKVQGKKKRDAEASEALRKTLAAAEEAPASPDVSGGGGDLLGSKDEDVIF